MMQLNSREQTVPFLGNRRYAHGTTLFRCMKSLLPQSEGELCFRIRKVFRTNHVRLSWCSGGISGGNAAEASMEFRGPEVFSVTAEPLPPVEPLVRQAYDENLVIVEMSADETESRQLAASPFDAVATVVPMFKALLKPVGRTPPDGSWFFTRLDARSADPGCELMRLRLRQLIPGKIAKASIDVGDFQWGDIYFSFIKNERLVG